MTRIIPKEKVLKKINISSGLKVTPREMLEFQFKSIGTIPISGGWGYTKDDAVIIDKDDPSVIKGIPFDGLAIEQIFVEKRTYAELITFKPEGSRFNGIEWQMLKQSLINDQDRHFDRLEYKICGHLDDDWKYLKEEYEKNNYFEGNREGRIKHEAEHLNRMTCYETEFWFDITSFYGKY